MILKRILICIALLHSGLHLFGQAAFSNVVVTSSEGRVTIEYDLQPTVERAVLKEVRLTVVFKGKTIVPETVGGAIGKEVSFGLGRRILWSCAEDSRIFNGKAEILLEADCEVLPSPEKTKAKPTTSQSFEPEMVLVEGGTFQMGSEKGETDEKPVHAVTLSSFQMGKYEVTQAQYQAVMGTNPSNFQNCDNCPVEQVSWEDAQEYIQKLNSKTEKTYRLPTEAEWEYAARGGNKSKGYEYSGSNDCNSVAWYYTNSYTNSGKKTHPVGMKQANKLGLYDMSGNVWEWCSDWYGNYSSAAENNPVGADTGARRVFRGGSWCSNPGYCRATARNHNARAIRDYYVGFRLVSLL